MSDELLPPGAPDEPTDPAPPPAPPSAPDAGGDVAAAASPAPAPAASAPVGLLDRLSDRINPILVREVLQSVNGRTFAITLGLALTAIVIVALTVGGTKVGDDAGYGLLLTSLNLLAPIGLFVVPLQAFVAMRTEVRAGTKDQLLLSRLTPSQIVRGKLAASLTQFTLFMSVFAPLMAMTFLLRGVDVPMIAFSLFYGFLLSFTVTAAALALGAMAGNPRLHVVLLGGTALGLAAITISTMGTVGTMFLFGLSGPSRIDLTQIAEVLLAVATLVVLFGLVAGSFVKHPVENRSTPFRVFMLLVPLVWAAWHLATAEAAELATRFMTFGGGSFLVFAPFWLFAATEEDRLSPRAASLVRRRPRLSRLFYALLPGAGRGVVFAYAWLALVTWLTVYGPRLRGVMLPDRFAAALCYVAAWSAVVVGLARIVRRLLPRGPVGTRLARLVVPALLLLIGFGPTLVRNLVHAPTGAHMPWSPVHALNIPLTLARLSGAHDLMDVARGLTVLAVILLGVNGPGIMSGFAEVERHARKEERGSRRDEAGEPDPTADDSGASRTEPPTEAP